MIPYPARRPSALAIGLLAKLDLPDVIAARGQEANFSGRIVGRVKEEARGHRNRRAAREAGLHDAVDAGLLDIVVAVHGAAPGVGGGSDDLGLAFAVFRMSDGVGEASFRIEHPSADFADGEAEAVANVFRARSRRARAFLKQNSEVSRCFLPVAKLEKRKAAGAAFDLAASEGSDRLAAGHDFPSSFSFASTALKISCFSLSLQVFVLAGGMGAVLGSKSCLTLSSSTSSTLPTMSCTVNR